MSNWVDLHRNPSSHQNFISFRLVSLPEARKAILPETWTSGTRGLAGCTRAGPCSASSVSGQ